MQIPPLKPPIPILINMGVMETSVDAEEGRHRGGRGCGFGGGRGNQTQQ